MPPTARTRDLIATLMLPVLLAPPVALADETLPTASEIDVTIHGTFNNGEDLTRPVGASMRASAMTAAGQQGQATENQVPFGIRTAVLHNAAYARHPRLP